MNPWTIIGWLAIFFIVILPVTIFVTGMIVAAVRNFSSKTRARRAHAGKAVCENIISPCPKIATRQTPNGYFCDDHWPQNARKKHSFGSVSYAHLLNHAKENHDH